VFTEQNPETGRPEQYVYVKNGAIQERRPVQIGVADYFNAEVVVGLREGEIISLEQPAEAAQNKAAKGPSMEKPVALGASRPSGGNVEGTRPAGVSSEGKTRPVSAAGSQRTTDGNSNR
jgi:hypothetical protein